MRKALNPVLIYIKAITCLGTSIYEQELDAMLNIDVE